MPLPSDELVQARLSKLQSLRDRGVDPYPRNYERTHTAREAIAHFESVEFSGEGESEVDRVSVGGRLTALRGMGRVTFCDILDGSGKIQIMFRSNALGRRVPDAERP